MIYVPTPGSVAERLLHHLHSLPPGTELTTSALAAGANVAQINSVDGSLVAALNVGVVFKRRKSKDHPRSPMFWSLVDHDAGSKADAGPPAPAQSADPAAIPSTKDIGVPRRVTSVFDLAAAMGDGVDIGATTEPQEPAKVNGATYVPVGPQSRLAAHTNDLLEYVAAIEAKHPEEPAAETSPARLRNAAIWMTGELALELDDGLVVLLPPLTARRLAALLRRNFE